MHHLRSCDIFATVLGGDGRGGFESCDRQHLNDLEAPHVSAVDASEHVACLCMMLRCTAPPWPNDGSAGTLRCCARVMYGFSRFPVQ